MSTLYEQLVDNEIVIDGKLYRGYRKPSNLQLNFPEIYNELINITSFLPEISKIGERIYCIKNNIITRVCCLECGKPVRFKDGKYFEHCSLKCSNNSKKVKEKKEAANIDKFGVKYASQSKDIQQKQRNTFQQKYGVDYPFQSKVIQEKLKQKSLLKHGVDNPRKSEIIKEKIKQTKVKNYGVESYAQKHIPKESLKNLNNKQWMYSQHIEQQKPLVLIAEQLGVSDLTVGNYLRLHNIETQNFFSSIGEKQILSFVTNKCLNNVEVLTNTRSIIPPQELDIFIPSNRLAIEYCGLYWHSEQAGKDRNYHKNKLKLCEKQNIRLLTIFEDEWLFKQNIVKSSIKNILNLNNLNVVYGRNTKVVELSSREKRNFLNSYHIQGNGRGSINYGLLYKSNIIACISFVREKQKFILNRYATSYRVIGGFSKLLKYFQRNNEWSEIISFADLRWSNGNLYEKTGFVLDNILLPDYYYIEHNRRVHKFNYRHKNLSKKLRTYDPTLSEKENCENNNILRIWNCGLKKYIKNQ